MTAASKPNTKAAPRKERLLSRVAANQRRIGAWSFSRFDGIKSGL
jgi:hypothetical protein